jgi:hypothetical protein
MTTVTATLEITSPDGTKRTVTLPPCTLNTIPGLGICVGLGVMVNDGPNIIDLSPGREGKPAYEHDFSVSY